MGLLQGLNGLVDRVSVEVLQSRASRDSALKNRPDWPRSANFPCMLIGSVGSFDARLSPDECVHRLNAGPSSNSYVGYVDARGFEFARYGRTAVRMRGTFTARSTNCRVDYRIEFIPWMLWTLVASYAIGIPLLVGFVVMGYLPYSVIVWAVVITAVGLGVNVWFSDRQAQWLKDYLESALDVK